MFREKHPAVNSARSSICAPFLWTFPIKAPLPKREIHDTGYGAMPEKWWKNQYPDVPSSMATSRINGHSALKALNMADDIAFGMDVRRRECCGELWDMLCINDCF